jgi:hypothetical protein
MKSLIVCMYESKQHNAGVKRAKSLIVKVGSPQYLQKAAQTKEEDKDNRTSIW